MRLRQAHGLALRAASERPLTLLRAFPLASPLLLALVALLQVYAPIVDSDGKTVLGAYEIYADPKGLEATIASRRHVLWGAVALVFLALWAALALLVRGASATLRRQTRQLRERSKALMEAYARLEESSLEAIESLNATVEAKAPATAGHSRRVQRISLALGAGLGPGPKRLHAPPLGSLFPGD